MAGRTAAIAARSWLGPWRGARSPLRWQGVPIVDDGAAGCRQGCLSTSAGVVASSRPTGRLKPFPQRGIRSPERARRTRLPAVGSLAPQPPARSGLDERSVRKRPGDDHAGSAVLLEPSHGTKPRLQPTVICLHSVVGVAIGAMPGSWQQLLKRQRVGRCPVGHDLGRCHARGANGPVEAPARRDSIPPWGDEHVDDLPELVDRPVHLPPAASNLHVRLVETPAQAPRRGGRAEQPRPAAG